MSQSKKSVDDVLDRMVETMLGDDAHFKSHALALGVPHNTIRTWKRRGEVPLTYLKNFALDWKVDIGWLLYGVTLPQGEVHEVREGARPYGLSAEEAALLEDYRHSPPAAQAALGVLAHAAAAAPKRKVQAFGDAFGGQRQPVELGETVPMRKKNRREELG